MKTVEKVAIGGAMVLAAAAIIWTLAAKPPIPPEHIVVSDLTIEPSQPFVGEAVTISVVVSNVGEQAGSYEVVCEVL